MIPLPRGWRRLASVGSELFASPDGRIQVRYRPRLAPLRRVADLVDETLAGPPEWRTLECSPPERLVTHEGEHAFVVRARGELLGAGAHRLVAAVYGDDFVNLVDAVIDGREGLPASVLALVHGASLGLGVRRRRYFYPRPESWRGHAVGLVTHWFAPTFPARPATIVVYPATPTHEEPQAVFDAVLAHQAAHATEVQQLDGPEPIASVHGLSGQRWTLACSAGPGVPVLHRDLVVYARPPYTYTLQHDALHRPDDEGRRVFLALARAVEPVPPEGVPFGSGDPALLALFSHYA